MIQTSGTRLTSEAADAVTRTEHQLKDTDKIKQDSHSFEKKYSLH